MLKTTFKSLTVAIICSVSLPTIVPMQTIVNGRVLAEEAQNELPEQWYSLYQISDRLARANGQIQNSWLIKLISEVDEVNRNASADSSGVISLDRSVLDKLAADSSALACAVAHEMGHIIQGHEIVVTEREQAEQIRQIRYEAEQEVKDRVNQEARDSKRNSEAANSIGGLLGGDAERAVNSIGGILGGGSDVPDREKMFDEIYARKEQELQAAWTKEYLQQELEADRLAYTYVAKAGYEPSGCIEAIEASPQTPIVETDEISVELPDSQERIANIEQLITQYPPATLAREGKTGIENSQPLNYTLASDGTTLEVGSNRAASVNHVATPTSSQAPPASTTTNSETSAQTPASTGETPQTGSANPELSARRRMGSEWDSYKREVGNMMFSKQPFSSETPTGPDLVQFNATDPIYARAYFKIPLNQALHLPYSTKGKDDTTLVSVDMWGKFGNQWHQMSHASNSFVLVVPKEQREKKYIDLDILPVLGEETSLILDSSDNNTPKKVGGFIDLLAKFDFEEWHYKNPGLEPINTYAFVVNVGRAVGDFELYMTPEEFQALRNRKGQQEVATAARNAAERQLPDEFNTPLVPFKDPELSIENIKRMLSDRHQILKIAIGPGSADYTVGTGNYDADVEGVDVDVEYVNSQMTARNIWVAYQDNNGQCFFQTVTFQRDYMGGGQYGELREVWASTGEASSDPTAIACENIN